MDKLQGINMYILIDDIYLVKMHTKTTKYGKPNFLVIKGISNASLKDFIGIDSWYLFKVLKIDTAFLTLPVDE